jgi:hypothetical protein
MNSPGPIAFDTIDGIAICRLTGRHTFPSGVHLVRDAIAQAHEQRISRLMLVITETTGYDVPSLSMRLATMREWAEAANGFVRLVVVCRPEFIDPHKFGVTMAANFGMQAEVFCSEADGMAWLRQLDPASG